MKKTSHAWYTRTEEGLKREVRATWYYTGWKLQSKIKGDEEWTPLDPPPLEDVQELHSHIAAKYARRRATHDEMVAAEKLLEVTEGGSG
jgi:hypothetical protein